MEFKCPRAIFEFVFDLMALGGKLSLFAHDGEPDTQIMGQGTAKNKTARIDGHDFFHALALVTLGKNSHGQPEQLAIGEDGRDVLENNSLLRKVGHVANTALEPLHGAFK